MSLLARFAERQFSPEMKAMLRATRETALTQLIRSLMGVALLAIVAFVYSATQSGVWNAVIFNSFFFVCLVVLNFARRIPYTWRAGSFVALLYGVAVVALFNFGIGGASRVYLLGFAVLTTIFFGARAGLWAGGLGLLTWAGFAVAFLLAWLPAPTPPDNALWADWANAFFGLLLVLTAILIPQRQFLEMQITAIVTAKEKSAVEEARSALQQRTEELEQVTLDATLANQQLQSQSKTLERRAAQLALSAEVARVAASLHNLPELLTTTVQLVSERFGYYHAGIFLADDAREWAVLQAANSEGGQRMLARQHRLRIGRQGIVGYVLAAGQARIAQDVGGDTIHYINPDLPDTRSEMALPITARGVVIGALDVQSKGINAFTDEDVKILQLLTDQIGIAIDNARLFEANQRSIEELRAAQRAIRRQTTTATDLSAYRYDGIAVQALPTDAPLATTDVVQVPLHLGDEALGILEIKRPGDVWQTDDQELAETIANRMALALENARLYDQARARAQQMTDLSEAALELTGPQINATQLLDLIARRALKLFDADYVSVWLPVNSEELELRVALTPAGPRTIGPRLRRGEGIAGQAFATGTIMRVDDYQHWAERITVFEDLPLRAMLGVPMTWQQHEVIGVLALSHVQAQRTFSPEDERAARLFASQAAAALENARLLQETQERIAELATINTVSQVATAQLELNAILETIGDYIFRSFHVDTGYIALYNRDTNLIDFPYVQENGVRLQNVAPTPMEQGLSAAIIRSRQPLLVNRDTARRLEELGATQTGAPAKSYLGVPIVIGDQAIGLISLQSLDAEGLFDEADVRLLTTIAANIGSAMQNAQLFAETQRRVGELATLNNISQTVTTHQDYRTLITQVGEQIIRTFPEADGGYIALYDEPTNTIEIPYFTDEDNQIISVPPIPLGQGLTSIIIQNRWPLLINQDTERRVAELGARVTGQPAKSYLGVPMLVGDKVVGVISLQNLKQEGLFTEADVRLLSTIAGSVGVGLENARLLEAVQQELTERRRAEALIAGQQHILELIAQGQEIYQTLEAVARFVEERAPQALCSILIMDADGEHLRRGAAPNLPNSFIAVVDGLQIGPAAGSCGTAAYQRQQIISTYIDTDPLWVDYRDWIITNFDLHACWSTPIFAANQRVLGTVALYHRESKAPTDRDLELIGAATHLAGIALLRHEAQQANELLLHETQQRAEELAALNRVTASATTLDLQSTLQATARELVHIFNARNCGVALLNPERTHLVVMADYSARPDDPSAVGVAIPLENNPSSQRVIETGRSLIITAPQTNPLTTPIHDLMRERHTTGLLIVPLRVRGSAAGTSTVIGTIGLDTNQPDREFTLAEAALTETIASQLSNAIENSRLFAETQRRAEQLAAAAEVARVSNALLEPDTLITQAIDLIRERFDLYYAAIFLVDDVGQWAKLRYATGEAGRKLMELGHQLEIGGNSMIGQAVSLQQARIALDVNVPSTDTGPIGVARFANPHLPDTRSEMALPLVVGGNAIGALSVQSTQPNAFSQADITVLQTMADQIATALQNARLFTAAQQEIAERIQAQKALDYERYLLHTLLENVPDKIYFKDQNSRFIRASQAVAHQFGLQANDLIGKWDFDFFSAEHAEQAYKDEQDLLHTGQSLLGKLERETWPNSPDTWALTSKLVMRDPDGTVIGSFGISRDVTELKLAQDAAQRRAQLLAAAADIGRAATASLDLDTLLRTSVNLIRDRFGFYHASVFIIDPKTNMAIVRESTGEAGKALKARQHQLAVGSKSLVGQATASRESVVVQDVTQDLTHFKNPLLPDTRAEAVLPLISADRVIGALDVQSILPNAFATEDMAILATIADQLAVAIQNANLFDRTARQARRERLVGEITNKIRAANSVEAMLQTAVTELRQALGVTHGLARLGDTDNGNGSKPSNGNGSASA